MAQEKTEEKLDPRVKAAREKTAAIEAQRAELAAKRAAREAIEAEENSARDAELALEHERAIEEKGAPLGRRGVHWQILATTEGPVIVKRPPRIIWNQLQELDKLSTVNVNNAVVHCLVVPDSKRYYEMCDLIPGLSRRVGNSCSELADGERKELQGK
jgi:hypothetical protein